MSAPNFESLGVPVPNPNDPVREDFLDFSTAWRIFLEVGRQIPHNTKCAAATSKYELLCNCGAVVAEWARRVGLQQARRG